MPEEERALWLSYIAKHGPINPLRRLDGNIAELCLLTVSAAGAKKRDGSPWRSSDFCNWAPPPEEEEATLDEAIKMFEQMGRSNRGKS